MSKLLATIQFTPYLLNSFLGFLKKLTFSYADFLDILIVALLIFFVLALLTKTKSTPIIIGIVLLGLLYGISLSLNLRLTQTIFGTLFGVLLILLVIVLQKELRRFFEMIGLLGLRRKYILPAETVFKTVERAVEYLAKHKTGAIIVFPGNENIERHLEGGITLDGRLSRPLLLSIFDKNSPGHDGAIIIKGDRIQKFGVHLPLAESAGAAKQYGTRHRAALGLAESTDAFAIIVSEEKGTISIAHNKKLAKVEDIGKLEDRLKQFYDEKFPRKGADKYLKWFSTNYKTIGISLLLSLSFWTMFTYQASSIQRKFVVPIQFKNLDKQYLVEDFSPAELVITLAGRESDFKLLDPKTLKTTIDLTKTDEGWRRIIIGKENISYPTVLSIVKIDSESIKVHITKLQPEPALQE